MTSKWAPLLILAAALTGCGDGSGSPATPTETDGGAQAVVEASPPEAATDASTDAAPPAVETTEVEASETDAPEESTDVADAGKWSYYTEKLPFVVGSAAGFEKAKDEEKAVMLFLTATW